MNKIEKQLNEKGKVIAWAITNEWIEISYIDKNGVEHYIKRR